MMDDLDAQLLAAHDAGDSGRLIDLYTQAASEAVLETAQGFYLTHAYVFALETGDPRADMLRQTLVEMGRETAL